MQTLKQLISKNKDPIVMGILNVTPDSFSDGGKYLGLTAAIDHAMSMIEEGALIIDIGGESTRPNAQKVSLETEKARIVPVIKALKKESDIYLSLDTNKPELMKIGADLGVNMINDIYALTKPEAMNILAESKLDVCLMHMQGNPQTMQENPSYDEVVSEVKFFLDNQIEHCINNGIEESRIMVDPGFGFGKTHEDNLAIFNKIEEFTHKKIALMIGLSRKSIIKKLVGENEDAIIQASALMAAIASKKGAKVLRVHDVKATKIAVNLLNNL